MEDREIKAGRQQCWLGRSRSLSLHPHISKMGLPIPPPWPAGASVSVCRRSEGCLKAGPCPHHQLPTEPVAQTTQGPPLPGSPRDHGKLPAPEPLRLAWPWSMRTGREARPLLLPAHTQCGAPAQGAHLNPHTSAAGSPGSEEHWQAVSLQLTLAGSSEEAPFCPSGEPRNVGMIVRCLGWTWDCVAMTHRDCPFPSDPL